MTTISAKAETVVRQWFIVDATGKTLGRMCTEIARRLRGKHKTIYTPHVDTGDFIIVINADKVHVTGRKTEQKFYHRHSEYPGGLTSVRFDEMIKKHPERTIEHAVKGMLPKGPLGRDMYRKLKVYGGNVHPHSAQQPIPLEV